MGNAKSSWIRIASEVSPETNRPTNKVCGRTRHSTADGCTREGLSPLSAFVPRPSADKTGYDTDVFVELSRRVSDAVTAAIHQLRRPRKLEVLLGVLKDAPTTPARDKG